MEWEEKGTALCYEFTHFIRLSILDSPFRWLGRRTTGQRERETTEESNEFLLFIFPSFIHVRWGELKSYADGRHAYDFLINLMNNWFKKRRGISMRRPRLWCGKHTRAQFRSIYGPVDISGKSHFLFWLLESQSVVFWSGLRKVTSNLVVLHKLERRKKKTKFT